MAQTVAEILTAGMHSVTLINEVKDGTYAVRMTQTEINDMVQRNVDHLELILGYTDPDVKGSSNSKKTDCTTAIATGKAYIAAN
jgi:hypothetical protein